MSNIDKYISAIFIQDMKKITGTAQTKAIRSVEFHRVEMYWQLGEKIVIEEQQGKERADYGVYLIRNLAKELEPEFGSGFSSRQLHYCRQFYRVYPIVNALRSQLNWSQYRMLILIDDKDKREYYEHESVHNSWTGRELERQINSNLYERLLLSNNKESVLAVARNERIPQSPQEIMHYFYYIKFSNNSSIALDCYNHRLINCLLLIAFVED